MSTKNGTHLQRLRTVAIAPSGRRLAYAGERDAPGVDTNEISVVELPNLKPQASVAVSGAVRALLWLDDDRLVAATEQGTLQVLPADGAKPKSVKVKAAVQALALDAKRERLAAVLQDGSLEVFAVSAAGLKSLGHRSMSSRPLEAVAFDPATGALAVGGQDGILQVLPGADFKSAEPRKMPLSEGGVRALVFTHDARLAAGCVDGSVRLVHLAGAVDEEDRSGDAAHSGPVRALVLGPQVFDDAGKARPRRLFSVGEDGVLKGWLIETRHKPKTVELDSQALCALVHLPAPKRAKGDKAGGRLAIVGQSRTVHLLSLGARGEVLDAHDRITSRFEALQDRLSARAEDARVEAVVELEGIPEDEARRLLERALDDNRPGVRRVAAEALASSGRRRSRPALRLKLDDHDKKTRRAAYDALTALENEDPIAASKAALQCSSGDLRTLAVSGLPKLRAVSPLVPGLVAHALEDSSSKVRLAALESLYALHPDDALAPASVALARGPADVRASVLTRLARVDAVATALGQRIVEGALDDEDAAVRQTALLVCIGTRPSLAGALVAAAPELHLQLWSIAKFGDYFHLGTPQDAPDLQPLFSAMACTHGDIALAGAMHLARLGDLRAGGAILQLTRDPDRQVKDSMVKALKLAAHALPDQGHAVRRLQWLLQDASGTIRSDAFDALMELGAHRGIVGQLELATLALSTSRSDIRTRALQLLVKLGPKSAPEVRDQADGLLGQALDDEASNVRLEALATLFAWHKGEPQATLTRAVASRQADVRLRVVAELGKQQKKTPAWARTLLLQLVGDSSAKVGLSAYDFFNKNGTAETEVVVHEAALGSSRPKVREAGCKGLKKTAVEALGGRLRTLVQDTHPRVHIAAIEATDRVMTGDAVAFSHAFSSLYLGLRIRAAELCGKRRDPQAIGPMQSLMELPLGHASRPSDDLRQRAASAMADTAHTGSMSIYIGLLDDADPVVREAGARGLAGACSENNLQPLVTALAHRDLAVRSWAAEGLARLGDSRAVPVLTGTLVDQHEPLRKGAILGLVALGAEGVQGILQALEDPSTALQDLAFSVVVARDRALAEASIEPDLLVSALTASSPELRYTAACVLEARSNPDEFKTVTQDLVGPAKLERASAMKNWPPEAERVRLLDSVVRLLASEVPEQRYRAVQVLALRSQPEAYWRESKRLARLQSAAKPDAAATGFEDEDRQARKRGWIRGLLVAPRRSRPQSGTERALTVLRYVGARRAVPSETAPAVDLDALVFGAYVGLVRQAPAEGESDETHRIRRDCLGRIAGLYGRKAVQRDAALPVVSRALKDPSHRVRRGAMSALSALYAQGALQPLSLALMSAPDVGKAAFDTLLERAEADPEAAKLARSALDAPAFDVRMHALGRLPRLYESGSPEPWLLALSSSYADVRLAVVVRLGDSEDPRVEGALLSALESDHQDLRYKAATTLAERGDVRAASVLAGFLHSENTSLAEGASEALEALALLRPKADDAVERQEAATVVLTERLENDPDEDADRAALVRALGRIRHIKAEGVLLSELSSDDAGLRKLAFESLCALAHDPTRKPLKIVDGRKRQRYDDIRLLGYLQTAGRSRDPEIRGLCAHVLAHVDSAEAETHLDRLAADREQAVRIVATEVLAFRAAYVDGASDAPLSALLRSGRRELVLPAAMGLVSKGRSEAFVPLLLVVKAGEPAERARAVLGLGMLGDVRALEDLRTLASPDEETEEIEAALAPHATQALGALMPHLEGADKTKVRELLDGVLRQGAQAQKLGAISGLRYAADEESQARLQSLAGDRFEDVAIRSHAVSELGWLGAESAEDVLSQALSERNRGLRKVAREALDRLFEESPSRVDLLALQSPYEDMSRPAATNLAQRGDPEVLLARLGGVKDAEVRTKLRRGLQRRGGYAAKSLVAHLKQDSAVARTEVSWLAGGAPDAALTKPLSLAVARAEKGWRDSALRADVRGAEQEAWRAGIWAARRNKTDIKADMSRLAVDEGVPADIRVQALRYLDDRKSDCGPIESCLSDRDPTVRAAATTLWAHLDPTGVLKNVSSGALTDVHAMGAQAADLVEAKPADWLATAPSRRVGLPALIGHEGEQALLATAGAKGTKPERLAALLALGRMGTARSETILQAILSADAQPEVVRKTAFKALRRTQRMRQRQRAYEDATS